MDRPRQNRDRTETEPRQTEPRQTEPRQTEPRQTEPRQNQDRTKTEPRQNRNTKRSIPRFGKLLIVLSYHVLSSCQFRDPLKIFINLELFILKILNYVKQIELPDFSSAIP
jgi:hypothetical protein